ncbi:MAG: cytidylate kinase family protein [Pirellulaceae bacterium]
MVRPRLLAISGDLGSGKTTVAVRLAEQLGWTYAATGTFQRSLASQLGIDTHELNRRAAADPSIDHLIDDQVRRVSLQSGSFVVESRMGFHFFPDAFSVYLYCDLETAADRVLRAERSTESYSDLQSALAGLQSRRVNEIHRFKNLYDVDIGDLRNYSLSIDTTFATAAEVCTATQAVPYHSAAKFLGRDCTLKRDSD